MAAAFDYKKEFKDLYLPSVEPSLVEVPAMTFAAVAGTGDPNEEGSAYTRALALLYGFSYTAKMCKMGTWQPEGYFDYVVPPLEGLWWAGEGAFDGAAVADKSRLSWVSLVRQPDFVTREAFDRICGMLAEKKPELAGMLAAGDLLLVRFAEGPCAQVLHKGPYDDEPATVARLAAFIEGAGLAADIAGGGGGVAGRACGGRAIRRRGGARCARRGRRGAIRPSAPRNLSGRPAPHQAREPQDGRPPPGCRAFRLPQGLPAVVAQLCAFAWRNAGMAERAFT